MHSYACVINFLMEHYHGFLYGYYNYHYRYVILILVDKLLCTEWLYQTVLSIGIRYYGLLLHVITSQVQLMLVKTCALFSSLPTQEDGTALQLACQYGHAGIVRELIRA